MTRRTGPRRAIRLTPETLPYIFEWAPGKCYWQGRPLDVTGYRVFTGRQRSQVAQWGDLIVERHDGSFCVASASDAAALAVEDRPDGTLVWLDGRPMVDVVGSL